MRLRAVAALMVLGLACAGCGKKGAPTPPGPPEQITYPKIYPTH